MIPGFRALYVSSAWRDGNPTRDASTLYRCIFPVLDLRRNGYEADFVPQREFKISKLSDYTHYIFHRPEFSDSLQTQVESLLANGSWVACDYDDLIFDQVDIHTSPRAMEGTLSPVDLATAAARNRRALDLFPNVLVSTEELLKYAQKNSPANTHLIHNGYSKHWLERNLEVSRSIRLAAAASPFKKISFFSGSASHNADLQLISGELSHLLRNNQDIVLQIVGPVTLPENLKKAPRILQKTLVAYQDLPRLISSSWLTLSPLDLSTAFNRCKSALKFFESAIFGIPCAASSSPDMLRFKDQFLPLIYPGDLTEHVKALRDVPYYEKYSRSAQNFAIDTCSSEAQTKKIYDCLEFK